MSSYKVRAVKWDGGWEPEHGQQEAAALSRVAARGMVRDAAEVLGVSPQRVSQLVEG